jgi:hypothetical protein
VYVPDEHLADLRRRIAAVRWPARELAADRAQGGDVGADVTGAMGRQAPDGKISRA